MKILFSILFLSCAFMSSAQNARDFWIEGRAKVGFLAAHRGVMAHLPKEYAKAIEVSFFLQAKGKKGWEHAYNNPTYGVTGFAGSVGNNEILGHYFGVYGFINFPFIKREHYCLSGKVGSGLGYGTKYYKKNFELDSSSLYNVAIGSSVNAQICLALENRFTFGNHSITANMDMTHFSNGAIKVPNLGLNLPYLSVGYAHRIKEVKDTTYTHETYQKHWEYGIMAIGGFKEIDPIGGRKYPLFGLNFVGRRYFRAKTGMEVSFDIFSKQAIMDYQKDIEKTQWDILQLGIFAGYLLPLDNFHIVVGMGYYLKDKYQPEDFLYHRVGMRYRLDNGLNVNLVLKSHWARADYVEFGLGYTFRR